MLAHCVYAGIAEELMNSVCTAGMNHIDMEYTKAKGIFVVNAAGLNNA